MEVIALYLWDASLENLELRTLNKHPPTFLCEFFDCKFNEDYEQIIIKFPLTLDKRRFTLDEGIGV